MENCFKNAHMFGKLSYPKSSAAVSGDVCMKHVLPEIVSLISGGKEFLIGDKRSDLRICQPKALTPGNRYANFRGWIVGLSTNPLPEGHSRVK